MALQQRCVDGAEEEGFSQVAQGRVAAVCLRGASVSLAGMYPQEPQAHSHSDTHTNVQAALDSQAVSPVTYKTHSGSWT